MNIPTAGIALSLLLALGTGGCDRRDAEPVEPSDTATSTIDDTPATATPGTPDTIPGTTELGTTEPGTETSGAVPPVDTCAGLTGEAEADCLMRNNDGLPPIEEPVNPEEETGADVPPTL